MIKRLKIITGTSENGDKEELGKDDIIGAGPDTVKLIGKGSRQLQNNVRTGAIPFSNSVSYEIVMGHSQRSQW